MSAACIFGKMKCVFGPALNDNREHLKLTTGLSSMTLRWGDVLFCVGSAE